MQKLFLWFYCLPIIDVVLLVVLATVAFFLLREMFGNTTYWKVGIPILLACYIVVILFGTLGQRTGSRCLSEPILTPFYSYCAAINSGNKEIYRTNLMNAVLFYPAGLLGCELLPKRWNMVRKAALLTCIFALGSIGIEYCQYHFGLGLAETDDVIHNTLGTLLGALACGVNMKRNFKK